MIFIKGWENWGHEYALNNCEKKRKKRKNVDWMG